MKREGESGRGDEVSGWVGREVEEKEKRKRAEGEERKERETNETNLAIRVRSRPVSKFPAEL